MLGLGGVGVWAHSTYTSVKKFGLGTRTAGMSWYVDRGDPGC